MDWQTIFYFVGSIFMIVALAMLLGLAVALFYLRKRLMELADAAQKPIETASDISQGIMTGLALKLKEWSTIKKAS